MTTSNEPQIIRIDGTVDPEIVVDLFTRAYLEGDIQAREQIMSAVERHKPRTFEDGYAFFGPVLNALNTPFQDDKYKGKERDTATRAWMTELGLNNKEHMSAMLAKGQRFGSIMWLMKEGADPHAVLDPTSPENLTIVGYLCRSMTEMRYSESPLTEAVYHILDSGQVPYSIKPRHEGDLDARTIFDEIMTNAHGAGGATAVLFDALRQAHDRTTLPVVVQQAIGQVCLDPQKVASCCETDVGRANGYKALCFARFDNPEDWARAFSNFGHHVTGESFFLDETARTGMRLIRTMMHGGARVDDVRVCVTSDQIPCTLLQAAAFLGNEIAVYLLIEAGADPMRNVGAGSNRYPIENLDAKRLWELDSTRGFSQALDSAAAMAAIQSVIKQASSRQATPPSTE